MLCKQTNVLLTIFLYTGPHIIGDTNSTNNRSINKNDKQRILNMPKSTFCEAIRESKCTNTTSWNGENRNRTQPIVLKIHRKVVYELCIIVE